MSPTATNSKTHVSVSTNENERSLSQEMSRILNQFIETPKALTWPVKCVGGEISINIDHKKVKFPDIVLYSDTSRAATSILQMWENKLPDVSITDEKFIQDAHKKARLLRLNSTVTWNFQFCKLWVMNENGDFECAKSWKLDPGFHVGNRAAALQFIKSHHDNWEKLLLEVFETVNRYMVKGVVRPREFVFADIESYVSDLVSDNIESVSQSLRILSQTDVMVEIDIQEWWRTAKLEFRDEFGQDCFKAYAKCIVLNWAIRIVFANAIKSVHFTAKEVEKITADITPGQANKIFESITNSCDFYNAFVHHKFSDCINDRVWAQICALNKFLQDEGMTTISQENLQKMLESMVSAQIRESIGQYTTPMALAKILTRITITNRSGSCIDPCCGSGTIVRAIIDYKKSAGITTTDMYKQTWGSDSNAFPLQMATIGLIDSETANIPIAVFQHNVFDIEPGKTIQITDPANGSKLDYTFPRFDYVLSNLPFVDFNTFRESYKTRYENISQKVLADTGVSLSGRSDMYVYILIYLWNILNDEATVGVVVSNSWMKSFYTGFYDALVSYYKIDQLLITSAERFFKNADVITNLMVLKRRSAPLKSRDSIKGEITKFETLRVALADMNDEDLDAVRASALKGVKSTQLRVIARTQDEIQAAADRGLSANALFFPMDWLDDCYTAKSPMMTPLMTPIKTYFDVSRGLKSSYDKAFYVSGDEKVDRDYLVPMMRTTKDTQRLIGTPDMYVVDCNKPYEELDRIGHKKTRDWFKSWESGLGANKSASANAKVNKRQGLPWYALRNLAQCRFDLGLPMNPSSRLICIRCSEPMIANQRIIPLRAKPNTDIDLCHALLNSLLFAFSTEASGVPMGLGALDNNSTTAAQQYMPDPTCVTPAARDAILSKFRPLLERNIFSLEKELTLDDRISFEHTVLQAYGLDDYYNSIVDTIVDMQEIRAMGKSTTGKKQDTKVDPC